MWKPRDRGSGKERGKSVGRRPKDEGRFTRPEEQERDEQVSFTTSSFERRSRDYRTSKRIFYPSSSVSVNYQPGDNSMYVRGGGPVVTGEVSCTSTHRTQGDSDVYRRTVTSFHRKFETYEQSCSDVFTCQGLLSPPSSNVRVDTRSLTIWHTHVNMNT